MKKTILNFFILFIAAAAMVSCEKDSDEEMNSDLIIGKWNIETVDADVKINGIDFVEFLMGFGFTQEMAEAQVDEMLGEMGDMDGYVEFKEDGTYASLMGDDTEVDTGNYIVNDEDNTITMDAGTDDEMTMDIMTLNDSKLSIAMVQIQEMDMDEDGTNEVMEMTMTMNFAK